MRVVLLILAALFCCSGVATAQRTKVLYLGDSRSLEGFGETVEFRLRADGNDVYAVVDSGAGPYHWLKAYQPFSCTKGYWEKSSTTEKRVDSPRTVPKIDYLLEDYRPDIVVVQTGRSLFSVLRFSRRNKADNIAEVELLVKLMCQTISKAGAKSYWILPPHFHNRRYSAEIQTELAAIMKKNVEKCGGQVFESKRVTKYTDPYPINDGVSYAPLKSKRWAVAVYPDLTKFIKKNGRPAVNQQPALAETSAPYK